MSKRILKNDFLEIEYLTDSLHIVGLYSAGKPNLMADVSSLPPIPTPYGDFHFHGGHRLWHSPEAMPRTYIRVRYSSMRFKGFAEKKAVHPVSHPAVRVEVSHFEGRKKRICLEQNKLVTQL